MRRPLALLAIVVIAAVVVVVSLSGGSSSSGSYRVAAIFDTANGMVAGQQVKIAGAVVGGVDAVQLAPGPKARIVMTIDRKFGPFHADASCSILPEGLISEDYIECNPGHAGAPLARAAAGIPTVPLARTTVPVSVQDVLNTFSLPVDERLGVLLSELGVATTGRGADLNALFARSNPALAQSQQVLSILDAQRDQLANAMVETNMVLGSLAHNDGQVREFVDRAATVATTTAQHSSALGQAINRLPAMLDALRPGLQSIDRAAANARPLLTDLHESAPGLSVLTNELPAFTLAGIPAFKELASAAAVGRGTLRAATPVVHDLSLDSGPLLSLARGGDRILVSLRRSGGVEGFLHLFYILATIGSLYDSVSHILTFTAGVAVQCIVNEHNTINVPGCDHNYDAPGHGRLPVNDPSCGVVDSDWENEFCGGEYAGLPGNQGYLTRRQHSVHGNGSGGARVSAGRHADSVDTAPPAAASPSPSSSPAPRPGGSSEPIGELQSLLSYLIK